MTEAVEAFDSSLPFKGLTSFSYKISHFPKRKNFNYWFLKLHKTLTLFFDFVFAEEFQILLNFLVMNMIYL